MDVLNEEVRKQKALAWRKTLHVAKRAEKKREERPRTISSDANKFLGKADSEVALPVSLMRTELSFSSSKNLAVRKELIAAGFIREHRMVGRGKGGGYIAVEVLPLGEQHLRMTHGVEPTPMLVTRSRTWKHGKGYPWTIKRAVESIGEAARFETALGDNFLDCVVTDRDGVIYGIEICLGAQSTKGIVAYNLDKARKIILGAPGLSHLKLAFEDRDVLKKVASEVRKAEAEVRERVSCVSLGEWAPAGRRS